MNGPFELDLINGPLVMRRILITRIIVGLIGIDTVSISSRAIPTKDRITMKKSNLFQLKSTSFHLGEGI